MSSVPNLVDSSLGTNSSVDSAPDEDSEVDLDEQGFEESSFEMVLVVCSAAKKICSIIFLADEVGEILMSLPGDGRTCRLANPFFPVKRLKTGKYRACSQSSHCLPGSPVRTGESVLLSGRGSVGVDGVGGGAESPDCDMFC